MGAVFLKVLDMSMTASFVILAVLVVRFFLRKSPKVISYALWAVVLFRLLCPVSLAAPVSLLEATQPQVTASAAGTSQISYLPETLTSVALPQNGAEAVQRLPDEVPVGNPAEKQENRWNRTFLLSWVWLSGAVVMVLHSLVSYRTLYRCLREASQIEPRVFLADGIPMPFVMGLLQPKIYLPSDTPVKERSYILAHERHHIRRGDHIIRLLSYAALCAHWFNPLVWLAFILAGKDMEMSCDEAVIRQLGPEIRADYAQTLLRMASSRSVIGGMPLAFGEGDTKSRVKNMVKWKQPKAWVVLLSVLLCILALVVCAVNPRGKEPLQNAPTIGMKIPVDIAVVENGEEIWFCPVDYENQKVSETPWGGVKTYPAPAASWRESSMDAWLRELGVPQIIDGLHDYMAGGNPDGTLEVSFADAGGRETMHYYYTQGETVFELWFDTAALDDMTQAAIRESLYFAPDASIERGLPMVHSSFPANMAADAQQWEEGVYLDRCRSVLESLHSRESFSVKILRNNYGEAFLNDTSTTVYFQDGADWLLIHKIPEAGFVSGVNQFGYMTVDGRHFSNEDRGMDEKEEVNWAPAQPDDSVLPWIATFDWNAQDVLYVSKIAAGRGLCFTLQVMAPYHSAHPDAYPYYQMQFIFNENGEFDRIENTFYFHNDQDGDYSTKETILILEDSAKNEIAYEYQRYLNRQS